MWRFRFPRRVLFSHQVAVLCQFLREVDYMTAFKALQEQNRYGAAGHTVTSSSAAEHLLTHPLLSLQSRRHGLVLRLHLGRHHPGVPHSYPSDLQTPDCLFYLVTQGTLRRNCRPYPSDFHINGTAASLCSLPWWFSDIHHKRGETEKRQIAVSGLWLLTLTKLCAIVLLTKL